MARSTALAGPISFTIAWLIGGLVQDEYSFRQEDISALAAMDAQYAWIMITGFVLLGAGTVALAAGLASTLKFPSALIGSVLLMIAGIGLAVAGLARNDCSSKLPACAARVDAGEVSWQHRVHDSVSLIIFLVLIAAPLVFARAFGRDDRWRPLRTYSIVTGLLGFALLVLYVIASAGAVERARAANLRVGVVYLDCCRRFRALKGGCVRRAWRSLSPSDLAGVQHQGGGVRPHRSPAENVPSETREESCATFQPF